MTVVPAQVAGVARIVVASPADRDGNLDPVLLGAAGLLGVDTFIIGGGAQAVGALAFGLPEAGVPPVDRIVGPGNAWVTAAKLEIAGEVGIDVPAGPSEGMVLADAGADPRLVAADLITQAEHGPDSPALLVTSDRVFAEAVLRAVGTWLSTASRRAILERALADHGRVVLAPTLDAAIEFANAYAPEHLSVDVVPLEATVARLRNAGSLFVGRWAPESAGDYATGANHVLPTGGLARASGGLSVESYGKFTQVQRITEAGAGVHPAHGHGPGRSRRAAGPSRCGRIAFPPTAGRRMTSALGELTFGPRGDGRRVTVARTTNETEITITLGLDGSGHTSIDTGIGFYDHLLGSLAYHGLFDLAIAAEGDLRIDEHHTTEDVALVLGAAFAETLGDRAGIARYGHSIVPMDEALATATIDVGGRPYAVIDLPFRGERVGALPLQLVDHALESFARTSGSTLHLTGTGRNDHHLAEAAFKALGRALRVACEIDPRRVGVASTKGSLG